jgi:hypothetical protein
VHQGDISSFVRCAISVVLKQNRNSNLLEEIIIIIIIIMSNVRTKTNKQTNKSTIFYCVMENFALRQPTLFYKDSEVCEAAIVGACVRVRGQGIVVGYLSKTSVWELEKETGM